MMEFRGGVGNGNPPSLPEAALEDGEWPIASLFFKENQISYQYFNELLEQDVIFILNIDTRLKKIMVATLIHPPGSRSESG